MTILNKMNDLINQNHDFLKRQEKNLSRAAVMQVMRTLTVQPNEHFDTTMLKRSQPLSQWKELHGTKENFTNLFKDAQTAVLKINSENKEALIKQRDAFEKTLNKPHYKLPIIFSERKETIKQEITKLNFDIKKMDSTIQSINERGRSLNADVDYFLNNRNEKRSLGLPDYDKNSMFASAYKQFKIESHSGIKETESQLSKNQIISLTSQSVTGIESTDKLGERLSITSNLLAEMEHKLNVINYLKSSGIQVSEDLRKDANTTIASLALYFDKDKTSYEQGNMALSFKNDKGIGIEASDLQRKGLTHQANEAENKLSNMLIKNDAALSDVTKVLASEDQKFNSLFQSNFSNERNEKQHDKEPALER
ncbi:hypothetical protein MKY91_20465 [Alkalicoccobacillus gibsonii]|uniref:LXG domain-containing protein n=1 Tax=Alkalicoccobacillus gibsonii TaxID=79881 RepID=A0ABU9VPL9_9BACI